MASAPTTEMLLLLPASVESRRVPEKTTFFSDDERVEARTTTTVFMQVLETEAGIQHLAWNATGAFGSGADKEAALYGFFSNLYARHHVSALIEALQKP